ncbi:hypothetical protein ASG77_11575 [Arthrobacter sp. Soil762]|nr:hypothetical protein ASG77_11575 [Arthrobacter sp. Soil762]
MPVKQGGGRSLRAHEPHERGHSPDSVSEHRRLGALQDWIDAGAKGTFVADCRITSSVRAPWLSEWMAAKQEAKAAVAG